MKARLAKGTLAVSLLLLCAAAAWSLSQFVWPQAHRLLLPFAFLGLILLLGMRYGRLVGILGTVTSALVFAHALYEPQGSFFVADHSARSALAWALLIGVSTSFLLLPAGDELRHNKK